MKNPIVERIARFEKDFGSMLASISATIRSNHESYLKFHREADERIARLERRIAELEKR